MIDLRRQFTSRVADPIVWGILKHSPVLDRLSEWRRRQWDSVAEFEGRQKALLSDLLTHAATRVPFYVDRMSGVALDQLRSDPRGHLLRFPMLTKRDLTENRDALLCEMGRGTYWNTSSGTTGVPVRFAQDGTYHSAALATALLFLEWVGVEPGSSHIKLWGARRDIGTGRLSLRRRAADWLANRTTLDAFDMTPSTMRRHLDTIGRVRPACLEGYVNALYELADFADREGISIPRPGCVVSSAGDLQPHMRDKMESVFRAHVYDRYGTRETGAVASECNERHGLHVFGETSIVEIVNDDGQPVAEGEEGEILITNLCNYTMPLIRYRIGDRGVLTERRCACGRPYPMIARLAGRSEARVYRQDGGSVLPEYFIYLFGVEYNDGSIVKFQVEQVDWDELVVRLVAAGGREDEATAHGAEASARIVAAMGGVCRVRVELVDRIDPTPTGKHLHVISRLSGGRS
ncbi:MAG: phenylacetate--CoA ligase family protein [Candidatus Eisenbacteria bacterium]|nr:phenylacetate--CoA ligase family protein [Candidatus Eisenbacteria bacterium]